MILNSTTDSLQIFLDKTASTSNGISYNVFFNEYTSTGVTPSLNFGRITGNTSADLISSPSANTQRQLKWASINNEDSTDLGVLIRFNDNGTYYNNSYVYLRTGETFQYTEEVGWRVYSKLGHERTVGFSRLPNSVRISEFLGLGNITGTQSISNSGLVYCHYMGKAERSFSSIKVRYKVTTQIGGTVSWAEMGIYRGNIDFQTNCNISRLGFTDCSGVWNSTGNKTTTITTSGMSIGDDLWLVLSNSTTGQQTIFRAGLTDNLTSGVWQSSGSAFRPSLNQTLTATTDASSSQIWYAWQGIV